MAISYDPREAIRQEIGTSKFNRKTKKDEYVLEISDKFGKTVDIPMFLSEEVNEGVNGIELPELPYIEMHRVKTKYRPRDIRAAVRRMDSRIDFKVIFNRNDRIVPYDFKKAILDELQDLVRTHQSIMSGTYFFEITDEDDHKDDDGQQITFEYIVMIHAVYIDAC